MILMNDFGAEPALLRDAMLNATRRVLNSGWYVLGSEVEEFERCWSALCGTKHAIGVGNGMDAIEIILRCLDIGPGDEVITTSMTAFATVLAVLRAGAKPVLADIAEGTAQLSPDSVLRCISPRTKALLLVHLYGQMGDMDLWQDLCDDNNIHLIEDCAQAHQAAFGGKVAGSFGVAGAYSFYPTKNLGAVGDAGMVVTSDDLVASRALRMRNYGQSERYLHPELGLNSRLDEIQAALLNERVRWLDRFTTRRREIAAAYREQISNIHVGHLAPPKESAAHVHHLHVIATRFRDELIKYLHSEGIQSFIHYPVPIHFQSPCRELRSDPQGLPATEDHARVCLSIPCHPQLASHDVQRVIDVINNFKGE